MAEELRGSVERVTFHNAENGFTVLRVRPRGSTHVVSVVGTFVAPAPGEGILASGEWRNDATYGRQFVATTLTPQQATGRAQIESFLGSGAIKGIGPSTAQQMYARFGEKIFDILDNAPKRLREISGIGPKRVEMITNSWKQQRELRELMIFLADTGIGMARTGRIQKQFGANAVSIIKENPYRLAQEIRGIGFATADAVALKLGLDRNSIHRIRAGVSHALNEASLSGHCGLPFQELVDLTVKLLGVDAAMVSGAIVDEVEAKRLRRDRLRDGEAIFLPRLWYAEKTIAEKLHAIVRDDRSWGEIDFAREIPRVEKESGITLAPSQRLAIEKVLGSRASVITGGPGVGKTTIIRSIVKIAEKREVEVALAAPTGRAARRLAESTGAEAKTIHRLLEIDPESGMFNRTEMMPLECDLLIVDEASMVDVPLMEALVRALPPEAALVLVGDVDQLPSVGPGEVLSDIINSGAVPVVRLTELFRQSSVSQIVPAAHAINHGEVPDLKRRDGDFFFVPIRAADNVGERVVAIVKRITERFGFDPFREIQVLAPMRRGGAGIEALNDALQRALNPSAREGEGEKLERNGAVFADGDKVMQIVNDYENDIFNGDVGVIDSVDAEEQAMLVDFDGRQVELDSDSLDDLVLAYAATIHKSQGSEYPAVVVVLTSAHHIMLQRNLLYTAVTRGKQLVVLMGEEAAVRRAVQTAGSRRRWTKLREWLCA
jgi:exodeoxyribonuclease V alpha subunit